MKYQSIRQFLGSHDYVTADTDYYNTFKYLFNNKIIVNSLEVLTAKVTLTIDKEPYDIIISLEEKELVFNQLELFEKYPYLKTCVIFILHRFVLKEKKPLFNIAFRSINEIYQDLQLSFKDQDIEKLSEVEIYLRLKPYFNELNDLLLSDNILYFFDLLKKLYIGFKDYIRNNITIDAFINHHLILKYYYIFISKPKTFENFMRSCTLKQETDFIINIYNLLYYVLDYRFYCDEVTKYQNFIKLGYNYNLKLRNSSKIINRDLFMNYQYIFDYYNNDLDYFQFQALVHNHLFCRIIASKLISDGNYDLAYFVIIRSLRKQISLNVIDLLFEASHKLGYKELAGNFLLSVIPYRFISDAQILYIISKYSQEIEPIKTRLAGRIFLKRRYLLPLVAKFIPECNTFEEVYSNYLFKSDNMIDLSNLESNDKTLLISIVLKKIELDYLYREKREINFDQVKELIDLLKGIDAGHVFLRQFATEVKKYFYEPKMIQLFVYIQDYFSQNRVRLVYNNPFFDIVIPYQVSSTDNDDSYDLSSYSIFDEYQDIRGTYVFNKTEKKYLNLQHTSKDFVNYTFNTEASLLGTEIISFEKLSGIQQNNLENQIQKQNIINKVKELSSLLQASCPVTNSALVDIIPHIKLITEKDSSYYVLELKAGTNKYYVVKNIPEFLNNIVDHKEINLSKNLVFNPTKESFTKKAYELISLLYDYTFMANFTFGSPKRELPLSNNMLDKILKICKNTIICYEDDEKGEYLVSDDLYSIEVEIDDYQFKTNLVLSDVIHGQLHDYIIRDGKILQIVIKEELRPLLNFITDNQDIDLSLVKSEFTNTLYPLLYDKVKVSEQMKQELNIHEYRLEIYFSLDEEDRVKYEIKAYSNEEAVNAKELSFPKINKLKLLLSTIGFDQTQITQSLGKFLTSDFTVIKELATVFLDEALKKMQVKKYTMSNVHVKYDTNVMSVCFDNLNYTEEELYEIIKSMKRKQRFVKLNKNTIVEITDEVASEVLKTVDDFDLDIHNLLKPKQLPIYQCLKLMNNDNNNLIIDDHIKNLLSEIANYKDSTFMPSAHLQQVMRKYQVEAFKWLKILNKYNLGGILADDMGLGKTLEFVSFLESDETNKPSLIVCPKSLAYNWKQEFKKWAPLMNVKIITGLFEDRQSMIANIKNDERTVYITSYDSLRNDFMDYSDITFHYLILDEAQYIKNHATLKAQSVKRINADARFVLTGTPIENSILDLWSIFDFLMPGYLNKLPAFKREYEFESKLDESNAITNNLVKKITPFILRRTKKDVLKDLPDKVELVRYAVMNEPQRAVYEAELLKAKQALTNKDNKIAILASLTRLRQLCVDPSLYLSEYQDSSCKMELLKELVEEYTQTGHKILIFSQFTTIFSKIEHMLDDLNIEHFVLTGETPAKKRVAQAEAFNEEDSLEKVFLISLKAGGTGLNLVGADIVIHLDPWWNISVENQASDRAHRMGQKNLVKVIKLVCENSIEQKVIDLQNEKKSIIDNVIANNDENIVKLSNDDLQYLLNDI